MNETKHFRYWWLRNCEGVEYTLRIHYSDTCYTVFEVYYYYYTLQSTGYNSNYSIVSVRLVKHHINQISSMSFSFLLAAACRFRKLVYVYCTKKLNMQLVDQALCINLMRVWFAVVDWDCTAQRAIQNLKQN